VPTQTAPLRVHTLIDSLTWGGAEMLLSDLAAGAPSAGIALSVGYMADTDGSPAASGLRRHGIEPELVPVRRMLEPGALPRLRRQLARVRPDVVHTHLDLADALGTLAARSLGLPSVSTVHLLAGEPTGQLSAAGFRGAARARLVALVRRHAGARVIAVSNAARDAYLATGWDTPQRVITVHNGIAREARPQQGAQVRVELGLEPDALVVSTLTVLRPGKGHGVVVEAVRRLLPRFPGLRLLVMGDGPARADIQRLAESLGATALLTGHRDDVMAVLMATDVLLHPTLVDAFPTALLEAAAARVPVVATAVGGIPEIVEDGETGFLVPAPPTAETVAARLEPLLADAALRARVGLAARERFEERFTAERWAARLRTVCDEVRGSRSWQRS
jgi:glycosyltransferase involved in cell wall biosynthesis